MKTHRKEAAARPARRNAAPIPDLDALQASLGYRFGDPSRLDLALTHRSYAHESGRAGRDNEAMEFLGDAVLGFVAAARLFAGARGRGEAGTLSRRRAGLVNEAALARRARALGVGPVLRLGRGEDSTGGRDKDSLLADAFEAIVAAIFLDGGLEPARAFVAAQLDALAESGGAREAIDPKTRLQEMLQAKGFPAPEYRVVEAKGPDHDRSFVVEVVIAGRPAGRGEGRTKKAAGTEAARAALPRIRSILRKPPAGA